MADKPSVADMIAARQQAQQATVLPTERQPYSSGLQPQEAGLEHPEVSPEELIAGGVAGKAAELAMPAARAVGRQGARLLADEVGSMKLPNFGGAFESPEAPAERMARAKALGFDTDTTYYHGTPANIEAFNPSAAPSDTSTAFGVKVPQPRGAVFLTKDADRASEYAMERDGAANVIPVHVNVKNTFDPGNKEHTARVLSILGDSKLADKLKSTLKTNRSDTWEVLENPKVMQALKSSGFDSAIVHEGDVPNLAVFHPENIRSKFAEFEPARSKSSKLSYAEGGEVDEGNTVSDIPSPTPATSVNVLNPEGQLVSIPHEHLQGALDSGYSHPSPEQIESHFQQEQYGSLPQQAIAGLEGVAQGVAGPLATGAERLAGVPAEDILGREKANPWTHGVGELAGFAGSAVAGAGQAAVLGKAGEAIGAATGLGKAGAGFMEQVGADAVKSAFESALYQGGTELADKFKEDPEQTAGSAISHVGMAAVMGGVFGGALGAALRKTGVVAENVAAESTSKFVSELDQEPLAAGDFKTTIDHAENLTPEQKKGIFAGLKERKKNANEIEAFAEENGLPVHPGMISASKDVQKVTSGLVEGPPTFSGQATKGVYDEGYKGATGIIEGALGEGSRLSKAQMGENLQQAHVKQIEETYAPTKELYEHLKENHKIIPLTEDKVFSHYPSMGGEAETPVQGMIRDIEGHEMFKSAPSSPERSLRNRIVKDLADAKTVDDVKVIKSSLNLAPTAAPQEKHMASMLRDKLTELEESSVERFAKTVAKDSPERGAEIAGLIDTRKQANSQYKDLMGDLNKLAKGLGKKRVYGPQDAINFIQEHLTPEQMTTRLFNKNNSRLLAWYGEKFPEQAALMRDYQKGVLREAATKEGVFSPQRLFTAIGKLEPEVQEAIFTKAELGKLAGAETYLQSFPKNYNPSNTSNMSALRDFFTSPVKSASANVRDFGMDRFVKMFGASPKAQQAAELGRATVSGNKTADKAVKALMNHESELPSNLHPTEAHREKLSSIVDKLQADPSKMLQIGDNNPVPEYAQAFSAAAARAVQYLSSIKPDTQPRSPLDTKHAASPFQKSNYNRALDIAQQPLNVLARMKQGTLTNADVTTLKTIYPSVYQSLSQKLMTQVMDKVNKGESVPYRTRLQLSMFLGQPLDSTMTQSSMAAIQSQAAHKQAQQQAAPQSGAHKSDAKSLKGVSEQAQTPVQSRQAARAKRTD